MTWHNNSPAPCNHTNSLHTLYSDHINSTRCVLWSCQLSAHFVLQPHQFTTCNHYTAPCAMTTPHSPPTLYTDNIVSPHTLYCVYINSPDTRYSGHTNYPTVCSVTSTSTHPHLVGGSWHGGHGTKNPPHFQSPPPGGTCPHLQLLRLFLQVKDVSMGTHMGSSWAFLFVRYVDYSLFQMYTNSIP